MADSTEWMKAGLDGPPPRIDLRTDVAHTARMYDYFIGGKDNFPADREAGDKVIQNAPFVTHAARANRRFLHRAVRQLAAEHGIRQFLDIGTGIPTSPNTHEIAQAVDPTARVVYVDNDPMVLAHARALLTSAKPGRTTYIDADLRDPAAILSSPRLLDTLDLDQPVALMLIAIMHFIPDDQNPYGLVDELLQALPAGSFLALSQVTHDYAPDEWGAVEATYAAAGIRTKIRNHAEVAKFFDGLEVPAPGVDLISRWWPEPADSPFAALTDAEISSYGAVGRKPGPA